jgi:O-antigen/teichoic acid export membrane protein
VPVLAAGYGVPGVLVCTAAADTVGVLIYGVALRSWHLLPRFRLAPTAWRQALSDAYPFALTAIIAIAYRRLDVMLLSARKGDLAAGQYGAAFSLWEAVGLVPASLLDAMFPEMARMARGPRGRTALRRIRRRVGPWLLIGGLLLSIASSLLAGILVPIVFGRAEGQSSAVAAFRLQIWAVPAMFLYLLDGHILYALGRQRWVTGAMAVTGLANLGLNLLIIPRWSVLGVSAVALLSAWLLWALLAWLARRALREET